MRRGCPLSQQAFRRGEALRSRPFHAAKDRLARTLAHPSLDSSAAIEAWRWCFLDLPLRLSVASAAEPTAEQIEFFENKIRPVLVEHCYSCHSDEGG